MKQRSKMQRLSELDDLVRKRSSFASLRELDAYVTERTVMQELKPLDEYVAEQEFLEGLGSPAPASPMKRSPKKKLTKARINKQGVYEFPARRLEGFTLGPDQKVACGTTFLTEMPRKAMVPKKKYDQGMLRP